jgi:hypothetical protein
MTDIRIAVHAAQEEIHQLRRTAERLAAVSAEAQQKQVDVVQLCWELGDQLQSSREKHPKAFNALCEGAGLPSGMVTAAMKVRALGESAEAVSGDAAMVRQALLCTIVPAKPLMEGADSEVQLCPPRTHQRWLNQWSSWQRKVELGLLNVDRGQLRADTRTVYEFLRSVHEC